MKVINLDPDFKPYDLIEVEFEKIVFPGGEVHIKIDCPSKHPVLGTNAVRVTTRIKNSEDFMFLLTALDALSRLERTSIMDIFIPYFPAARQDRIMVEGEALSVKLYANILNKLYPNIIVKVYDPHSEAVGLVLNRPSIQDNHTFALASVVDIIRHSDFVGKSPIIISPDAGSNKKINQLMPKITSINTEISLVKCDKTRNVRNGNITGFEVYADSLKNKDCIIIDDICDGGGTFLGLAKSLKEKGARNLFLVVSHGIFSKGFEELTKYFSRIYTTNSFQDIRQENVLQYKLENGF